jgi:uncharacterized protein
MKKIVELVLPPPTAFEPALFHQHVVEKYDLGQAAQTPGALTVRQLRRSVDARAKQPRVNVQAAIWVNEPAEPLIGYRRDYPNVAAAPPVVVVGAGPAGMFAALRLIELGLRPVLLERGGDVRARRRDLAAISKHHQVNPESNYCFGEGGAGTYSDGKLYTRSTKRGDFRRILEIFVAHGAAEEILVDAHPHIGTNKLPQIVANLRQSILEAGGQVHFNTKVVDLVLRQGELRGVKLASGELVEGLGVILATGHSARDIFELLHRRQVPIEAKPYALGVRVEHPQTLIDQFQYHSPDRGPYLPAASYSLVSQVAYRGQTKGVFSFCMCPGGFIVPSATAPGEVVVNGMSPSRRNSRFANSGIVVPVEADDLRTLADHGPLAGLVFQQQVEQRACQLAGGTQAAPAQRLIDFVNKKVSTTLPETSYQPGLAPLSLDEVLPPQIAHRLRVGFQDFGKKIRGYLTNEAVLVGVESRTSSPVRIPRDPLTGEHPQVARLFPCGEGAGYAGGIASAAMDGERCAELLAQRYGQMVQV